MKYEKSLKEKRKELDEKRVELDKKWNQLDKFAMITVPLILLFSAIVLVLLVILTPTNQITP